jgi:hypothetical protein
MLMIEKQNLSSPSSGADARSQPGEEGNAKSSSKAKDGARDLAQNVKHVADGVVEQARKTAETQVSDNKARAVEGLSSVAKAIRKTGENLRADDQNALTGYLDRAATQVDMAAGYIRNRTVGQIFGDVESFARRAPAFFLGGAFVAGLVGGRFLKSSRATPSGASSIHAHVFPHARNGSTSPQPQAGGGGGATSKSGPAHRDTTAPKSSGGS